MVMDERKQRVLQAIVTLYQPQGEPVGSTLLANYFDMAVSSATLRNEMAALTKLGLLEQPHTSAGRVPSAEGYRYYLQQLLQELPPLSHALQREIDEVFASLDQEPEKLAQGAARALAQMTGCTAAVIDPGAEDLCIAHFEVVQVGRSAAAVLAVTGVGGVLTRMAHVSTGLTRQQATALAALLNRTLTFVAPVDVTAALVTAACEEAGAALAPVVLAAAALLKEAATPHVHVGGEQYLLDWPELRPYAQRLLITLSNAPLATRMIHNTGSKTRVLLGSDFTDEMPGVCVLAARYLAGGGQIGSIALIGPTRMPYSTMIPVLEAFAVHLGTGLSGKARV